MMIIQKFNFNEADDFEIIGTGKTIREAHRSAWRIYRLAKKIIRNLDNGADVVTVYIDYGQKHRIVLRRTVAGYTSNIAKGVWNNPINIAFYVANNIPQTGKLVIYPSWRYTTQFPF